MDPKRRAQKVEAYYESKDKGLYIKNFSKILYMKPGDQIELKSYPFDKEATATCLRYKSKTDKWGVIQYYPAGKLKSKKIYKSVNHVLKDWNIEIC